MNSINISTGSARIDSELLRTFLAVCDSGSISRGAERILRSQSAVSLQIKRLEELVGQPLFERHGRGVVPTAAGEALRPVAERVAALLDTTLAALRADGMAGRLAIGIPDEFGQSILPRALAAFTREHPNVELTVRCALSADFATAIDRGELDLAVYDSDVRPPDSELLREQRIGWATSRRHGAHMREPLPLALFDRDCWWRAHALDALRRTGREFRVVYSSESVAGIVAAIEAGIAVGLLQDDSIRGALDRLTEADGLPEMPGSKLILKRRRGVDAALADAMSLAIRGAFAAAQ